MFDGKTITIIAAMARNRGIGLEGKIPWHLPGELQHFKQATMGKPIVMGRKTWESIGRALPGRQNLLVTRNPDYRAEGCETAMSLEQAISMARGGEVMIIGGGQLYTEALPLADRMVLTLVDCESRADTWFPQWSEDDWNQTDSRSVAADRDNPHAYQVMELVRKSDADGIARAPGKTDRPPA